MTYFFALPEEASEWLSADIRRLDLEADDEQVGRLHRIFVWPEAQPRPSRARGVAVDLPRAFDGALISGRVSWTPSAFDEPIASEGSRLRRQLARSLRRVATIPLFAASADGVNRSPRPMAFGTPRAVDSGLTLRQWRDAPVHFEA